jgi:hypothetical protein
MTSPSTWDVSSVDVDWLNLNLSKHFSKVVVKFSVTQLTDIVSLGRLYRINVHFDDESTSSCFLKLESGNAGANKFATRAKCFESEAIFYKDLSALSKARVPACYYASCSPVGDATTLLLHDVPYSFAGNKQTDLTLGQLKAAVIELGKFHASFLEHEKVLGAGVRPATATAIFNTSALMPLFASFWGDLLNEYAEDEASDEPNATAGEKKEKKNKTVEIFTHCALNHANYLGLLELCGRPGLAHGEFNASNLLFGEGSEKLGDSSVVATIVDFQTLYIGKLTIPLAFEYLPKVFVCVIGGDVARADDLNSLLVSSVSQNVRVANENAMIGFYLAAMAAALPEEQKEAVPSLEEFTHYYKMATQGMIYRVLLLNMMLSGLPEEQRRLHLASLVERVIEAVNDHGLHTMLAIGKK